METALLELIADRDLAQITISDVTKRAGVNRSTFYEHYTDLADLAASACTVHFDQFVESAPRPRSGPDLAWTEHSLTGLFAHVAAHAHLYRTLLGAEGSARVINHLLQRITIGAHDRGDTTGSTTERPHDPGAAFVAGAVLGAVIDWLALDCPGTPQQMATAVAPLLIAVASTGAFGGPT